MPDAGTLNTRALFDVQATKTSGVFSISDGGGTYAIGTQKLDFASIDKRGAMEFHLGGLPQGATITSASLTFSVTSITYSTNDYPSPKIYGYTGNGAADVTDATQTANLLATAAPVTDTGLTTVSLDGAAIQGLLAQGNILGILVVGSENGKQFNFDTLEGTTPVSLSVSYTVPEPSVLALGAMVCVMGLARRARGRVRVHESALP